MVNLAVKGKLCVYCDAYFYEVGTLDTQSNTIISRTITYNDTKRYNYL